MARIASFLRQKSQYIVAVFVCGIVALSVTTALRSEAATPQSLAGAFQCWKFNVGMSTITQVGQSVTRCTSPDLLLAADGTYTLGSEKGRFTISGGKLFLSASQFRGAGTLLEQDIQIYFSYEHNGKHYDVTYLKRDAGGTESIPGTTESASAWNLITIDLTLIFPPDDKSATWINTVTLLTQSGDFGAEALAVSDGASTVKAYFRAVRPGKTYSINVGSGFDTREVGTLDLTRTTGRIVRTINVSPVPEQTVTEKKEKSITKKAPRTKRKSKSKRRPVSPPPITTDAPKPKGLPCNPLIPRYQQPGCVEG